MGTDALRSSSELDRSGCRRSPAPAPTRFSEDTLIRHHQFIYRASNIMPDTCYCPLESIPARNDLGLINNAHKGHTHVSLLLPRQFSPTDIQLTLLKDTDNSIDTLRARMLQMVGSTGRRLWAALPIRGNPVTQAMGHSLCQARRGVHLTMISRKVSFNFSLVSPLPR